MESRPRTTAEVVELLDVPEYRLRYLIRARTVPAPRLRAGGVYLWQPDEIAAAAEALGVPVPDEHGEAVAVGGTA
ncbi:hypothetical protein ACFL09_05225 [Planctomycetota bacterium]